MIARVRGVIADSVAWGSSPKRSGSTSTNTGRAPSEVTALALAKYVNAGTITSSSGPTPSARRAIESAAVPEDKLPGAEHALEVANQFLHEGPVHGAEIQKRDGRFEGGLHGSFAVARAITTGRWPVRSTCC